MKSPLTGKVMHLKNEKRNLVYRKEAFEVVYHFYLCAETDEQFTTAELDILNLIQVHNQYRAKYGIPFIDEIKNIREKYGLSAAKMSEVLGLGANVYRHYESGEIPSVATGRLIRLAEDPREFQKLLEIGKNALNEREYEKVKKKIEHTMYGWHKVNKHIEQWLFGTKIPNVYTGFSIPNLHKTGKMVSFFAEKNQPFTTALNKLMFYADFGHFKKYGVGISGICYHALQKGPVPNNYGGIYNQLVNSGYITIEEKGFKDFVGEMFHSTGEINVKATDEILKPSEIEILNKVSNHFQGMNTKQIVEISHDEEAWKDNVDNYGMIDYLYSFKLKHFD